MKRSLAIIPLSITALIFASRGIADAGRAQDAYFVMQAAQAGMAEVQCAALARRKSTTPQVVAFATRMRDDHSRANAQLASIAHAQRFALPSTIGASNQKQLATLESENGHRFDIGYLTSQLRDHHRVLTIFQKEASTGNNTYIVSFAQSMIPVLEQHIFVDRQDLAAIERHSSKT